MFVLFGTDHQIFVVWLILAWISLILAFISLLVSLDALSFLNYAFWALCVITRLVKVLSVWIVRLIIAA